MSKKANEKGHRPSMGKPQVRIGKLSDFRPQVLNANQHTERGLRMLDDSMSEDGYVAPMTAVADGEVIDGSARLERAFDKFNDEAIILEHDGTRPIITKRVDIPDADNPIAKRIALRANRIAEADLSWNPEVLAELAEFDPNTVKGMFSDKELAEILTQTGIDPKDAEPQIDKAEELRQKWGTETGQLWVIGDHRLLVGDATNKADVGRLCANVTPSLMVTDPPYGLGGYAGRSGKKLAVAGDELDVRPLLRSLPDAEHRYIWCEWHTYPVFLETLGTPTSLIVWGKPWFGMGNGYRRQHEFCLYYGEFNSTSESDLWMVDYKSEGINSTWQRTAKHDTHPTQKPLECMARPIRNHSGDVYDPFVGSGTTLVAAENLNRKCFAIEISPAYVAVCLERMTTAFPHLKIEKVDQARAA